MECLFFINPACGAGAGERLAEDIENFQLPGAVSKQVIFTDPARLEAQVHSCASGRDLVVICGGDGTINGVISSIVHLDPLPAVAFIPMGTGNDLARATGWYDSWLKAGLNGLYHSIKRAQTSFMDVWELAVTSEHDHREMIFCAYVGIGCDGMICSDFARIEHFLNGLPFLSRLRKAFYVLPGLKALLPGIARRSRFSFKMASTCSPGLSARETAGQILFLNISSYAGGTMRAKSSSHSDGRLDCFMFRSCFSLLWNIILSRLNPSWGPKPVDSRTHYHFRVYESIYLQVDGEPWNLIPRGATCSLQQKRSLPLLRPLKDNLSRDHLHENPSSDEYKKAPAQAIKPLVT